MKFTCQKNDIYEAVINTAKAASDKSTINSLEGLLFSLNNNKLNITGYDLEIGIKTVINVDDGFDGDIVLNAKLISEIIKKMPDSDFKLEVLDQNNTEIKSGDIVYNIIGISADEYPTIPEVNSEYSFSISHALLKSMLSQTNFAIATNEIKPVYTGSKFDLKDKILNIVSVDGFRIAKRSEFIDYDDMSFIVPGKTLTELLRLLSDDTDKLVKICISNNQISFVIDNYVVISRLMDGEFIDYKKIMSFNTISEAIINVRDFADSMERTLLLTSAKYKSVVKCDFIENEIHVNCSTPVGMINDRFVIEYTGDNITIGFNAKYILDALKATDCDKVKILLNDSTSPIKIIPLEGNEFMFIVLPVRLK